ncbi:MAG: hypothetical protein M3036_08020 [Bifidobacteriales bacterium]|nr:hypothetical protein [Bifidobacteriales bacterium]
MALFSRFNVWKRAMKQRKQPTNTISDVIVGVGFFTAVLMVSFYLLSLALA